jgi:hemerythrin superfamily protein
VEKFSRPGNGERNAFCAESGVDAIDVLKEDHERVRRLFRDRSTEVFQKLLLHAQIEEEIFYPAIRDANPAMVDKSVVEHDIVERLIQEIEQLNSSSQTLLEELRKVVEDHMMAEEKVLFPQARRELGEDLGRLGDQIRQRKEELSSRSGQARVQSERATGERVSREEIDLGRFESEGGRPSTPPPPL